MGGVARFAGVGILVVGALLPGLSGCGGGAGPEPQLLSAAGGAPAPRADATREPAAATPTAAPDMVPAVPDASPEDVQDDVPDDVPEEAREHTAEGAEAFARHFIASYNSALRTGVTETLSGLGREGCDSCDAYVEQIDKAYADGGRIVGGRVSVLSSAAPALREGSEVLVEMRVSVARQEILAEDGSTITTFPAERSTLVFYPLWTDDGWVLDEIKLGVAE